MDDKRFAMLREAFISQIEFSNYLESYGEEDIDLSNINYNLLMTIFIGFYFTTVLDEYIDKSDDTPRFTIVPVYLDQIVSLIAKKHNSGWKIGELSYRNSSVVLDKVRNKLAHGDYIVEDDKIIFEEKGKKGIVDINRLLDVVATFEENLKTIKEYGQTEIISGSLKYVENRIVSGTASFKKYCKDLILLFVRDEPKPGYKRTTTYISIVKHLRESIQKIFEIDEFNSKRIENLLAQNKKVLELHGIDITYEIKTVYDLDYYDVLLKQYLESADYTRDIRGVKLGRIITNKVLKLSKGQFQKFNASKGVTLDLALLEMFRDNPGLSFLDIFKLRPDLLSSYFYGANNTILAADLVGFNSFYQYGLEKGLTKKGCYDFAQIVVGESLDFSLLELDKLDDPDMVIEHKFECYKTDIQRHKDCVAKLYAKMLHAADVIQNYVDHTPKEKRDDLKTFRLQDLYHEAAYEYKKEEGLITEMEDYYSTFDHEKYVRNINILEHVRNAIAHGWILIDEYNHSEDFTKKDVIIEDYDHDGNLVYRKQISLVDFSTIYKMRNFYVLDYFITHNIKDKSLIDHSYVKTLNDRINTRKN